MLKPNLRQLALAHPLLVSIAPVLLLAGANVGQFELSLIWLPLAGVLFVALVAWGVWWVLLRDVSAAAILTSVSMIIFLTHGHIHRMISLTGVAPKKPFVLHLAMLTVWLVIVAGAWIAVCRWKERADQVAQAMSLGSLLLVALGAAQLIGGHRSASDTDMGESVFSSAQLDRSRRPSPQPNSQLPDIYYLVLDGYGRHDQLAKCYGYDNSEFLRYLEDKGFYIAEQSHSNYALTQLSLASSLNLRYLTPEAEMVGRDFRGHGPTQRLIRGNDIAKYLKAKGYCYVHLNTWWGATTKSAIADVSYPPVMSEFHHVFLETTILKPLPSRFGVRRKGPELLQEHFRRLKEIPQMDVPTFTLAHIICPHFPFYFHGDGEIRRPVREAGTWTDRDEFVEQLIYLNKELRGIIDAILATSERPPMIILQADHGTASLLERDRPWGGQHALIQERMAILNAYYVPLEIRRQLYPTITPVNTFRVLVNGAFDEELPLLSDRVFLSGEPETFDFMEVTEQLSVRDGEANGGAEAVNERDASY